MKKDKAVLLRTISKYPSGIIHTVKYQLFNEKGELIEDIEEEAQYVDRGNRLDDTNAVEYTLFCTNLDDEPTFECGMYEFLNIMAFVRACRQFEQITYKTEVICPVNQ